MKILVITGSPHKYGTSNTLAKSFCEGAVAAGHQVSVVDAAKLDIHPCQGCYRCRADRCGRWDDDMQNVYGQILDSDMLVFVTPLYFYHMASQLKILIDRFHCINGRIKQKHMDSMLLCAGWNTDPHCMDGVKYHYEILAHYMKWNDRGQLYAFGCTVPEDLGDYKQQAYRMGQSL